MACRQPTSEDRAPGLAARASVVSIEQDITITLAPVQRSPQNQTYSRSSPNATRSSPNLNAGYSSSSPGSPSPQGFGLRRYGAQQNLHKLCGSGTSNSSDSYRSTTPGSPPQGFGLRRYGAQENLNQLCSSGSSAGSSRRTTPGTPGGSSRRTTPGTPGGSSRRTTPGTPGGSSRRTTPGTPGGSSRRTTPGTPGVRTIPSAYMANYMDPRLEASMCPSRSIPTTPRRKPLHQRHMNLSNMRRLPNFERAGGPGGLVTKYLKVTNPGDDKEFDCYCFCIPSDPTSGGNVSISRVPCGNATRRNLFGGSRGSSSASSSNVESLFRSGGTRPNPARRKLFGGSPGSPGSPGSSKASSSNFESLLGSARTRPNYYHIVPPASRSGSANRTRGRSACADLDGTYIPSVSKQLGGTYNVSSAPQLGGTRFNVSAPAQLEGNCSVDSDSSDVNFGYDDSDATPYSPTASCEGTILDLDEEFDPFNVAAYSTPTEGFQVNVPPSSFVTPRQIGPRNITKRRSTRGTSCAQLGGTYTAGSSGRLGGTYNVRSAPQLGGTYNVSAPRRGGTYTVGSGSSEDYLGYASSDATPYSPTAPCEGTILDLDEEFDPYNIAGYSTPNEGFEVKVPPGNFFTPPNQGVNRTRDSAPTTGGASCVLCGSYLPSGSKLRGAIYTAGTSGRLGRTYTAGSSRRLGGTYNAGSCPRPGSTI